MAALKNWIGQDSTKRGLILILTLVSARLNPANAQILVEFGLGIVGVWLAARKY